jgi:DNA repair protein RecO (recombination protein O)
MASEQTDAIVLRLVEFSETSLIVTLYTRDLGRISAIAKGARRPKSAFEGALDLLCVCRIVVISKASDALDILTEAKLQRRFRAAGRGLTRLYCGYYIAELLRLWTSDGSPSPDLYQLSVETLQRIDSDSDALSAVLFFELQGMRLLGNAPATARCVDCGGSVAGQADRVAFGYQLGGVLCERCRLRHRDVVSLRRSLVERIGQLQLTGLTTAESIQGTQYRELRAVLSRYITTALGSPPRTQSLLPAKWVSH